PGRDKQNGNKAAWCRLFPDERGGVFGDFSTGTVESWQANHSRPLTLVELEAFRRNVEETKARAEAKRKAEQADAARIASERWQAAKPAGADHPYLVAKKVRALGIRRHGEGLLIPMRDAEGALHNVERIFAE